MKGLKVTVQRCIGCRACSLACGKGAITVRDDNGFRIVTFPGKCSEEECKLCVEVCPTQALEITETPFAEAVEHKMELAKCRGCGSFFTTVDMLNYVRNTLPHIETAEEGWIGMCRACREKLPLVT